MSRTTLLAFVASLITVVPIHTDVIVQVTDRDATARAYSFIVTDLSQSGRFEGKELLLDARILEWWPADQKGPKGRRTFRDHHEIEIVNKILDSKQISRTISPSEDVNVPQEQRMCYGSTSTVVLVFSAPRYSSNNNIEFTVLYNTGRLIKGEHKIYHQAQYLYEFRASNNNLVFVKKTLLTVT